MSTEIVIRAGEEEFVGNKVLLRAHSGYFRAALSGNDTALALPSLSAPGFAVLLSFMYTGHLALNADNVYHVLLAAQVLHMPTAVELCRIFLQTRQRQSPLIKPIPISPWFNPFPWFSPNPFSCPPLSSSSRFSTPFKDSISSLFPTSSEKLTSDPESVVGTSTSTSSSLLNPSPSLNPFFKLTSPPPTWSSLGYPWLGPRPTNFLPSTSPPGQPQQRPHTPQPADTSIKQSPLPQTSTTQQDTPVNNNNDSVSGNGKFVLDIACCDGPVQFQRVYNTNYDVCVQDQKDGEIRVIEPEPSTDKIDTSDSNHSDGIEDGNYHCVYCNHSFKSYYCFQKHKRRHINPITIDMNSVKGKLPRQDDGEPAPVKLLDFNVQYYPCKTCGSKFPSYYFVHKHRRMCHPNEEPEQNTPR